MVCGLLAVVASLVVEHRPWSKWAPAVVAFELSCPSACGIFLDSGMEPSSPALAFRFFTTESPRQSLPLWFLTSVCVMIAAAAAAKSLQSCPTLCDPIDGSPPGSAVPRILQARTLEWVAISLSNAWKWKVKVKLLSCVRLSATPWTAAYQAPPSMGFSRQEYWSGVPLPSLVWWLRKSNTCYAHMGHLGFFLCEVPAQVFWSLKILVLSFKTWSVKVFYPHGILRYMIYVLQISCLTS